MKSKPARTNSRRLVRAVLSLVWGCLYASILLMASVSVAKAASVTAPPAAAKVFDSPQQAADALVAAAETFDVPTLTQIFGPDGADIVLSGEFSQDRKHATDFA